VKELFRSTEMVFLSWLEAFLKSENIKMIVLDEHMSVLEGSGGAIPRRVVVADEDYDRAKRLFEAAGVGDRVV
jgi:hypothetical protein